MLEVKPLFCSHESMPMRTEVFLLQNEKVGPSWAPLALFDHCPLALFDH